VSELISASLGGGGRFSHAVLAERRGRLEGRRAVSGGECVEWSRYGSALWPRGGGVVSSSCSNSSEECSDSGEPGESITRLKRSEGAKLGRKLKRGSFGTVVIVPGDCYVAILQE